jgi:hypothetical protein
MVAVATAAAAVTGTVAAADTVRGIEPFGPSRFGRP